MFLTSVLCWTLISKWTGFCSYVLTVITTGSQENYCPMAFVFCYLDKDNQGVDETPFVIIWGDKCVSYTKYHWNLTVFAVVGFSLLKSLLKAQCT